MSELDEIEKMADGYAAACDATGNRGSIGDDLARFVLLAMPVLKAAVNWQDTDAIQNGGRRRILEHKGQHDLHSAISKMREELGRK